MASSDTQFKKGTVPWNKGKSSMKRLECIVCLKRYKTYKKNSKYCSVKCRTIDKVGEKHPRFNKNKTTWLSLRKIVLIEQDYTCQVCGWREKEIMEVNHKLERADYPELAKDKNNLEVLCPNCHRRKTNLYLKNRKNRIK